MDTSRVQGNGRGADDGRMEVFRIMGRRYSQLKVPVDRWRECDQGRWRTVDEVTISHCEVRLSEENRID